MAPKRENSGLANVPQINVKRVPGETAGKLQIIAGMEGLSNNDLYIVAFQKLVENYEKKHGKLRISPKGKGLEGL